MNLTQIKTKGDARQYAIDWQKKASEENYSWGELAEFTEIFTTLGRKFGLLKEFKENGIL